MCISTHLRLLHADKATIGAEGSTSRTCPDYTLRTKEHGGRMPTLYTTGKRIDHYQIMRPLGRGGASHVYLAQDWHALQEVVLKFPDDALIGGAAVFERYKREAEIGRRLNHQYIQRHLNQDEQRSAEYLVLEYMRGRTLRMVVEECAPGLLPTGEVLRMLIQVCSALAYAHEHGVIHRDIKPENIMLLENGEIKIFDFGIALLEGERNRSWRGFSSPIGTPDYMAPERLLGESGDVRSDIYAVGVVLYELLCGRTPFEEEDGFALITTHISHDPPMHFAVQSNTVPRSGDGRDARHPA